MAGVYSISAVRVPNFSTNTFHQEATMFPDWGKMNFTQYPRRDWHEVLHGATRTAVDLVNNLVEYESSRRLDASQVRG